MFHIPALDEDTRIKITLFQQFKRISQKKIILVLFFSFLLDTEKILFLLFFLRSLGKICWSYWGGRMLISWNLSIYTQWKFKFALLDMMFLYRVQICIGHSISVLRNEYLKIQMNQKNFYSYLLSIHKH
jgi:hypothetical protein